MAATIVLLQGCSSPLIVTGRITEAAAGVLADAAMRRHGELDLADYVKSVHREREYWVVDYEPRNTDGVAFDAEKRVYVSRTTGDARVSWGH